MRRSTLSTPWGRREQAPRAFIRGQFETSPENRLQHPCFFCLDPPRRPWTQKSAGQECYQHDPRAAMLKALMGGGGGGGGAAENRIRMVPAESEWPISPTQPKAGTAGGPAFPREKNSGKPVPPLPKSIREQQNAGKCSPRLTKAKPFSPGLHIKEPDQNPPLAPL